MTQRKIPCQKRRVRQTVLAFFLFLTLILAPVQKARAAAGEHGVTLGAGQILLMGDFAKNFNDAIGLHLQYTYEASAIFGLLLDLSMSSHSNADSSNTMNMKGITPNLRINLAYIDKLVIYSFTGFGLFMVDEKVGSLNGSVMTLGFDMGAGFNLSLNKHLAFGTTLSFHNIFGKTDSTTVTTTTPNGLSIGGTYLALMLNATYIF